MSAESTRPVLVTAGATRNPLDAMRYISSHSSGRTGVQIAAALAPAREVLLLGSPEAALRAQGSVPCQVYDSTRDLMARMETWVRAHPRCAVVHAAAVGDYEAEPDPGKIESGRRELLLRLTPTPKIADAVKGWGEDVRLVTFKAAAPGSSAEAMLALAQAQLTRTGSELVLANTLGRLGADVLLVWENEHRLFPCREQAIEALLGVLNGDGPAAG